LLTCSNPQSYSAKPGFFHEENRANLFEVVPETGMLLNTDNGSPMPQVSTLAHHFIHSFISRIKICVIFFKIILKGGEHLSKVIHISKESSLPSFPGMIFILCEMKIICLGYAKLFEVNVSVSINVC
jgi:hypothetical protein